MYQLIKSSAVVACLAICSVAVAQTDTLLEEHIEAIGGKDAIAKIKSMERKAKVSMTSQFGDFEGTTEEGAIIGKKSYQNTDLGIFQTSAGWDGDDAWSNNPQLGIMDADDNTKRQLQQGAEVSPVIALKEVGAFNGAESLGEQEFDGKACEAIKLPEINGTLFIDKATKLLAGMKMTVENPQFGEMEMQLTVSDYKDFDGVKMPTKQVVDIGDGMMKMTTEYTDTNVNVDIADDKFSRPE